MLRGNQAFKYAKWLGTAMCAKHRMAAKIVWLNSCNYQ